MNELDTLYGRISVPDWPGDLIVRALTAFGEWAAVEQRLFSELIDKNDRVWDGGAYLGTFGLGAVQMAAAAGRRPQSLLAIEPGREIAPHLHVNLERNSPCPWDIAPFAISFAEQVLCPEPETVNNHGALAYVPMPDAAEGSPVDPLAEPGRDDARMAVQGLPLWQLRERHGNYDCLKLDIEGMEFDALQSDFSYLQEHKPAIWVECNESPSSLKILEALTALEYEPLYIAYPAFRTENYNGNPERFFPMAYEASLVAASAEQLESLSHAIDRDAIIAVPVRDAWELRKAMWVTPRWADETWVDRRRLELIALLGRMARNEDLGRFLNP